MAWIEPFVIVVFACLVIGYLWGHRRGRTIGQEVGALYVPLELRRQSLLAGRCQICGSCPPVPVPVENGAAGQTLEFVKMYSIGRDYICVDLFRHKYQVDWSEVAQYVSDPHDGIGSDGLILIMPSHLDGQVRFFRADGSEWPPDGAVLCCAAKYLYDLGLAKKTFLTINTVVGDYEAEVLLDGGSGGSVKVDLGEQGLATHNTRMPGARLFECCETENHVYMTGSATISLSGQVNLDLLMKKRSTGL